MKPTQKPKASKYVKLSHEKHILELPDTYIGDVEQTNINTWVFNRDDERMIRKDLAYVPGLYKIFDEILVNTIDQVTRLQQNLDNLENIYQVKNIKIDIDVDSNIISVFNDGNGIDVVKFNNTKIYIPELIFGHLLTSSNYDKSQKKIVGGKNGYGAKLANIFSTEFVVETVDHYRKKRFRQKFQNNMTKKSKPSITDSAKKPYTCIKFKPDLKRFGLTKLTKDILSIFEKRVYDTAGILNNINIYFNGLKIKSNTFKKYMKLYLPNIIIDSDNKNNRWEIGIGVNNTDEFQQISFVNGINTLRGGSHVNYILNMLIKYIITYFKQKKKIKIKPSYVKNYICLFINCVIENPSFDSQTKETLTTKVSKFGSTYTFNKKFLAQILKSSIIEKILYEVELRNIRDLQKNDGKKKNKLYGIPKLEDAHWAGTKKSSQCTLILTEGDSAKSMAVAGLSIIGRQKYGIFPLKGKLLNVKDISTVKISNNNEITNIKKILGLKNNKKYETLDELRYGKIMILTDQDVDGSHIKGLLFNLFHTMWPELLSKHQFMISMLTPIVKVSKKKQIISFYSLTDFDRWINTNNTTGWKIKYYKGLGTSSIKEAKEYFKDLKIVNYNWDDAADNSLNLAFDKKRANLRKDWLGKYNKEHVLDFNEKQVSYTDFIHKDLIHFSNYDTGRSIPSMCDGLKISQRKILFSGFKKNLKKEIKVAQFSGYISEQTSYHHGEMSLQGAIVSMAQNYVGSNNINLFEPNGQFGTRLMGGKDSASSRYIHTTLSKLTEFIFRKEDQPLLTYLEDDGYTIEPEFYIPIIPMILVNGSIGIGTGFSTNIPSYHPLHIVENIKNILVNKKPKKMKPWFRGFKGDIIKIKDVYYTKGKYFIMRDQIIITELPVGTWTDNYKEFLEKKKLDCKYIRDIVNNSTESEVRFEITMTTAKIR